MATKAPEMWSANDGSLWLNEADADDHDVRQSILDEVAKGFDSNWNGHQPSEVLEWLLKNYDLTKRDIAVAGGLKPASPVSVKP